VHRFVRLGVIMRRYKSYMWIDIIYWTEIVVVWYWSIRLGVSDVKSSLWAIHPILGWIEFGMAILGLALLLHMLVFASFLVWMVATRGPHRTKRLLDHADARMSQQVKREQE